MSSCRCPCGSSVTALASIIAIVNITAIVGVTAVAGFPCVAVASAFLLHADVCDFCIVFATAVTLLLPGLFCCCRPWSPAVPYIHAIDCFPSVAGLQVPGGHKEMSSILADQ